MNKKKPKMKVIGGRVEQWLYDAVKERAEANGETMSVFIGRVLEEAITKKGKR